VEALRPSITAANCRTLLPPLYMSLRNGFPGNSKGTYGRDFLNGKSEGIALRSRAVGLMPTLRKARIPRQESTSHLRSAFEEGTTFARADDRLPCVSSSVMNFYVDVATKNGSSERKSNQRALTKVVKSFSQRPSPMNLCSTLVTKYRP